MNSFFTTELGCSLLGTTSAIVTSELKSVEVGSTFLWRSLDRTLERTLTLRGTSSGSLAITIDGGLVTSTPVLGTCLIPLTDTMSQREPCQVDVTMEMTTTSQLTLCVGNTVSFYAGNTFLGVGEITQVRQTRRRYQVFSNIASAIRPTITHFKFDWTSLRPDRVLHFGVDTRSFLAVKNSVSYTPFWRTNDWVLQPVLTVLADSYQEWMILHDLPFDMTLTAYGTVFQELSDHPWTWEDTVGWTSAQTRVVRWKSPPVGTPCFFLMNDVFIRIHLI
jgi:hypothetical protein